MSDDSGEEQEEEHDDDEGDDEGNDEGDVGGAEESDSEATESDSSDSDDAPSQAHPRRSAQVRIAQFLHIIVAPFVRLLLWFFFPIAYTISKVLDWMSGKGHAALLRRKELKTFVDFHGNEANGHRVMTVAPPYDQYKDAWDTEVEIKLKAGDKTEKARFFHCYKRGVDRVFIDHPMFLEKVWGKTASTIYGPVAGTDYLDNQIRFSLLCRASLEAPRVLNLNSSEYFSRPYGEDVFFIANAWHTAFLPCYLKSMYQIRGLYMSAKVAFCIHNIAYQGRFAFADFELLNLRDEFKSSFDFMDGYEKPVKGRKINSIKDGILELDKILTVSPYYAEELVSGPDKGVENKHPWNRERNGCPGMESHD
ncbi:hypothetical protein L1987_06626 [Smallanthus sonchifolius]|uniref:Uncharacterized protein n=1 Tax=Smallanthus sonchifolius TaxID=185202 RepID=A0ACB9JYL9_9ASTR|nr:hypothetical protein L1987_06626 [Smallanthus sonchifolius]